MRIDRFRRVAGEQIDRGGGQTGIKAAGDDLITIAGRFGTERSPSRDGPTRDQKHVEKKLNPVFCNQLSRQIPD